MPVHLLRLQQFRAFAAREWRLAPQFNLLIGAGGSGKTALLEALACLASRELARWPGQRDVRPLLETDTRRGRQRTTATLEAVVIDAAGQHRVWQRDLTSPGPATLQPTDLPAVWPLMAAYGLAPVATPRPRAKPLPRTLTAGLRQRLTGHQGALDGQALNRPDLPALEAWLLTLAGPAQTQRRNAVRAALLACVDGAKQLRLDTRAGQVLIQLDGGHSVPLAELGSGSLRLLGLVADLARRCLTLNPQLGAAALAQTPGLVLIDALEHQLHPLLQRRVVEHLRHTFAALQFVCSSQSPFMVQSLRSGEELIVLDGQPLAELGNKTLDDIARLMSVAQPEVSERYAAQREAAGHFLQGLARHRSRAAPGAALAEFQQALSSDAPLLADNPALQAFLDMQRAAQLGS